MERTRTSSPALDGAVAHAIEDLVGTWVSTPQANRVASILGSFSRFAIRGHGVSSLGGVTPAVAAAFVGAPVPGTGELPSVPLMHLRRLALRLLFRAARRADPSLGDPTLDLVLPPRSQLGTRPLTDGEVALCRATSEWSLHDRRRAAAWALAEATCRTVELGQISRRDVDLDAGRVWIHGGKTTADRWGTLSDWGGTQLDLRLRDLPNDGSALVVYDGAGPPETGQISSCIAVRDVLVRAGLGAELGVRPASVAAWAGRRMLESGAGIEEVARRLGMASLDRTVRFIGWEWSTNR